MADPDEPRRRRRDAGARRAWQPLPTQSVPPVPLRRALDTVASTLGLTDVDSITALFVDWPDIVGPELASRGRPRSLRDGVLTVEASDQQWATELQWMSALLVARCCEVLGPEAVTSVRVLRPS